MKHILSTIGILFMAAVVAVAPAGSALAGAQQNQQNYKYMALGDSIAAGAGLSSGANATALDEVCDRSPQAYSSDIANYYNIPVQNITCSGAKADEGLYDEQERSGREIPAQIDRAFQGQNPDLVTITIGVNDLRWQQFIGQCIQSDCGSTFDNARAQVYLADLRIELNWALWRIYQKSGENPPLVAISGYYNPLSSGSNCTATRGITAGEARWAGRQLNELNSVVESAADNYYFADYVPVNLNSHGLCSNNPWVQDINDPAPLHPTARGQEAIAEQFLQVLQRY